jgi:hypothetical protein
LEYLSADGTILLKWIVKKWEWEGMDWVVLVEDSDRWGGALVHAVTILHIL